VIAGDVRMKQNLKHSVAEKKMKKCPVRGREYRKTCGRGWIVAFNRTLISHFVADTV
jgi:hypothetical protein